MPNLDDERVCPKRDVLIFLIIDTSDNVPKESRSSLNRGIDELLQAFKQLPPNENMSLKLVVLEFNEECKVITGATPKSIEKLSLGEIHFSDKAPDFGNMLRILLGVIKDICNRNFTRFSFIAPFFIFLTTVPTENKYATALEVLNKNHIYQHGNKIAFSIDETSDTKLLADIVGSDEAIITASNIDVFPRLIRFYEIEVDPMID